MAAFHGVRDLGKRTLACEQISRDLATRGSLLAARGRRGQKSSQQCQAQDGPRVGPHAPPPAISALPPVLLFRDALLSAECLYHEITHAIADMMRIPEILITKCIAAPPEISASRKCPAKARNTPRQKISRECWPHRISGRSHSDFSPGQSFGRKRTVIAASARKCANLSTSRSVLLIGYIHCSSQRGIRKLSCGKYQVSVTQNAANRYAAEIHKVIRDDRIRGMRLEPPSTQHAPNTNSNCQANGLKAQKPFG